MFVIVPVTVAPQPAQTHGTTQLLFVVALDRDGMPTFAAVVDVPGTEVQNAQEFAAVWGRVGNDAEELGAEVSDTYALLGRHDFLVVFDAPDIEAAFQLSLATERYGLDVETMTAIPVDRLGELVEEI